MEFRFPVSFVYDDYTSCLDECSFSELLVMFPSKFCWITKPSLWWKYSTPKFMSQEPLWRQLLLQENGEEMPVWARSLTRQTVTMPSWRVLMCTVLLFLTFSSGMQRPFLTSGVVTLSGHINVSSANGSLREGKDGFVRWNYITYNLADAFIQIYLQ